MGPIAILGGTSQIAQDFIRRHDDSAALVLFSRKPEVLAAWLARENLPAFASHGYEDFSKGNYAAILNFVGSGDPARTAGMGAEILDVTHCFDTIALDYLKCHRLTRYLFLSSGAAYGSTFLAPPELSTPAVIPINELTAHDYYGVAKLHAETRHRALSELAIVDIRVFGYFSRHIDIAKRFFVTDILRAIRDGQTFETGKQSMQRDFIGPQDFAALIACILSGPSSNGVLDAYSRAPVEKFALLAAMQQAYGLKYRLVPSANVVIATGAKPAYFSKNRAAAAFGYEPALTSQDVVMQESRALLERLRGSAPLAAVKGAAP